MRRSLLVMSVLVVLAAPMAYAQEGQQPSESLLLIMDSSGSMNRVDGDGVPLIDGAKQALRVLVSALPEDAHVGLRVYGHRFSNDDKVNGCADTELVIPVGPVDRDAMVTAIDSYEAVGWTPIGLSLQQAAEDLPPTGHRTIVLVSDGIDTCAPPDPCDVAAQLADDGLDVTIHTVGLFLTDPEAEQQLQCIADSSGGHFTRVDSIVDLIRDLTGIVTGAISDEPGRFMPVLIGSLDRATAPLMVTESLGLPGWPAEGSGASSSIAAGETRWYSVDVPPEGSWHIQASATLAWQLEPGDEDYAEIVILDDQGTEIGVSHEVHGVVVDAPQRVYFAEAGDWVPFGDEVLVSAVTDPANAPPGWDDEISADPGFAPTVQRLREAGINQSLYELWKANYLAEGVAPGRYFIGLTWSSDQQAMSGTGVNVTLFPAMEPTRLRDASPEFVLQAGGAPGAANVGVSFSAWTEGSIGGEMPLRSAEIWTPLTTGQTSRYAVSLAEAEVLEIGLMSGSPYGGSHADVTLSLESDEGARISDLYAAGRWLRLSGYDQGGLWKAPSDGTYHLNVVVAQEDPPSSDLAAILSMFVFEADPESPVATDPASTEGPEVEAQEADDQEVPDEGGDFAGILIAVGATAVLLGGGGAWWIKRRMR